MNRLVALAGALAATFLACASGAAQRAAELAPDVPGARRIAATR